MMLLSMGVYDQENGSGARLKLNLADRVPAVLPCFVNAVRHHETVAVFEYEGGQFKRNSLVLALVAAVLLFIPFVTHSVYTHCTT